ncbi:PfkB family carbohydrate kinase [Thiocapsa sp.]|uniref:PfkB family carbohydrate kinase n=1 Tax=Thiocapsa sp. TaxID=2024551 RepID=UPI002C93DD8A|nr:PfkB family carbohydrate kinase [Thiocapsa sp.]HSO82616.1 PfkB family carbohydrate kinase [Thiocapsa sp.]
MVDETNRQPPDGDRGETASLRQALGEVRREAQQEVARINRQLRERSAAEGGAASVVSVPTRLDRLRNGGSVLGVGIAVLDLVNEVEVYPAEDDEVRALAMRRVRGGNVTNSLAVLSQLGHPCRWAGTLGEDPAADLILADLARHGIETRDAVRVPGGTTPTSSILLSRANGSRTIVHFRDLPELSADDFGRVSLDGLARVHFEGRNPQETARMIRRVREEAPDVPISVELEKRRPGIEELLHGPQLLLASRAFARAGGFEDPGDFLDDLLVRSDARLCVVAWGAEGAAFLARGGHVQRVPAYVPTKVVDTLGAGDVFNAGVIHGLMQRLSAAEAVTQAVTLAGLKCGHPGIVVERESSPLSD